MVRIWTTLAVEKKEIILNMLSKIKFDMIILREKNIIKTNDFDVFSMNISTIYPLESEKVEHAFWLSNGSPHIFLF